MKSWTWKVVRATPDGSPIEQFHLYEQDYDGKWLFFDYALTMEQAYSMVHKVMGPLDTCIWEV